MGAYVALAPVFDARTGRTYMPGRTFEMEEARAAFLPYGYAAPASHAPARAPEPEPEPPEPGIPDMSALYGGMTNAQLADIAAVRGLEVPKKATKAQLLAILAGE